MNTKHPHNNAIADWSSYWALGHLTSLPNAYAQNYEGEFEQFWAQSFRELASDAQVVDICSGNGSIALLCKTYSDRNHKNFAVTACDAASIKVRALTAQHPEFANQLNAITILSRTPLNRLDIPDHSIDLVTSQFGFEYTHWAESATIIARLIKRGGNFSMVSHRPDSTIVIEMRQQQVDFEFLSRLDLFSAPKKRPNSAAAAKQWLTLVERTLNEIYQRFQANRESFILRQIGEQLESIKQQAHQQFRTAHTKFIELAKQVTISYVTATDLTTMADRLESEPYWHLSLIEAGLELIQQHDIHYETGDVAAIGYVFRKT